VHFLIKKVYYDMPFALLRAKKAPSPNGEGVGGEVISFTLKH
jgi:hypothetical protein